jgi:hypothetical protein
MANTKITNPELFNLGDSTLATQLPVMTTTQRIAMVPTAPASSFNIDYLVVAGGGAGGGWYRGGGGGAGELKESASSVALSTGSSYVVTIGAGGVGVGVSSDNGSNGNNGSNSTFYNITSLGGGGGSPGDSSSGNTGSDGGSGGGAGGNWGGAVANGGSATGTGLGNNGGVGGPGSSAWQCGGGGGGAIQAGFNAGTSGTAGDGGAGKTYTDATSITGQAFSIAGGGGGANYSSGNITVGGIGGGAAGASGTTPYTSGPSAANNTGGGGGGGNGVPPQGAGGNGGSGIVILRYATADVSNYTTTGITPTEDTTTIPGQTILSFTTVGTGTINFTGALTPGTPPMSDGEMIFNSTTDKVEYWDGTKWYGITYEVVVNPAVDPTGNGGVWAYYPLTSNSNDSSGNNRNATNNGVSFSADGGRFTGGNSISPPTGFIDFGYTQTCWVKDLSTLAPHRIFSFNGHAGGYYGFTNGEFYYYNSSQVGFFTNQRSTSGTYYYTSNTINNFNSGYNLVVAQFVSGQLVKFSLNGQTLQTGTVSITSGNPGGPFQTVREIGRGFSNGTYTNVQDCYFRNYRLYDRTLTDAEITAIYTYGSV